MIAWSDRDYRFPKAVTFLDNSAKILFAISGIGAIESWLACFILGSASKNTGGPYVCAGSIGLVLTAVAATITLFAVALLTKLFRKPEPRFQLGVQI